MDEQEPKIKGKGKNPNSWKNSPFIKGHRLNVGTHLSEETKRKIGIANAIANKGQVAWNKGKTGIYSEETRYRMGSSFRGKHPKSEWKKGQIAPMKGKERKDMKGDKNVFWNGGISFIDYTQDFNNFLKNKIRQRDNQICMNCGIHREKLNEALHIHHIDYNKKLSIPENLISLCKKCHTFTIFNREYWTKLFQEKLSRIYNYQYNKEGIIEINIGEII
jgi:hypothetical protein